jgi:hypothetical protein
VSALPFRLFCSALFCLFCLFCRLRLGDPLTSCPWRRGRPDPRPDVREDETILSHLEQDFDFSQTPRSPVLLATNPPTDSPSIPAYFRGKPPCVGCTAPPPG